MTSEVVCSGCGVTVPWPAGGVRTNVEWDGKGRRVTMVDLTSGSVFHRCAPPGGVDDGPDGGWGNQLLDITGPEICTGYTTREFFDGLFRPTGRQALPDAGRTVMGRVRGL